MKTFLNKTEDIEQYLLGRKTQEETLLFDAKLLLDQSLSSDTAWQKQVYHLVNTYSRKKLKAEIEAVQQKLFTAKKHNAFRRQILSLFLKP